MPRSKKANSMQLLVLQSLPSLHLRPYTQGQLDSFSWLPQPSHCESPAVSSLTSWVPSPALWKKAWGTPTQSPLCLVVCDTGMLRVSRQLVSQLAHSAQGSNPGQVWPTGYWLLPKAFFYVLKPT